MNNLKRELPGKNKKWSRSVHHPGKERIHIKSHENIMRTTRTIRINTRCIRENLNIGAKIFNENYFGKLIYENKAFKIFNPIIRKIMIPKNLSWQDSTLIRHRGPFASVRKYFRPVYNLPYIYILPIYFLSHILPFVATSRNL